MLWGCREGRPRAIPSGVRPPSDTLTLAVSTRVDGISPDGHNLTATFTGSVAAASRQTFRSGDFTLLAPGGEHLTSDSVDLYLTAMGSGYVELGTTASTAEDAAGAYRWSIGDSVHKSTDGVTYTEQASAHIPRFNVIGHTTETLRILAGPSPSSMDQRYTDRWDRMPAVERWWAVAGDLVGHVPVPASGALAPIGVAMAMATIDLGGTPQLAARAERRALGVWESAGNGRLSCRCGTQRRRERSRCATKGIRRSSLRHRGGRGR